MELFCWRELINAGMMFSVIFILKLFSECCWTLVNTGQKWPFRKGVKLGTAILYWFQLFYFLTRIIPVNVICNVHLNHWYKLNSTCLEWSLSGSLIKFYLTILSSTAKNRIFFNNSYNFIFTFLSWNELHLIVPHNQQTQAK